MIPESTIDIDKASHKELVEEFERCQELWGKYSCDCFGFYISALKKAIVNTELGFSL